MARELGRGSAHGDPAIEQKGGMRTHPKCLGDMVVREDDRGSVLREALKQVAEPFGTDGIDAREGFIADEDAGKPGHGSRELEPAALAR